MRRCRSPTSCASRRTASTYSSARSARDEMRQGRLDPYLPMIGVIGLIILWYVAVWCEVVTFCCPRRSDTFRALWNGMVGGRLGFDFWRTLERTILATLIAAAIAIPLGIFLGRVREALSVGRVRHRFLSLDAGVRHVPAVPGAVRGRRQTKISVAAFGAALVILFNVAYGVMNARKTRLLAAKVMGASRLRVLTDVMLLESLPQTFVGLRNGVSLALVIIVVAARCSSAPRMGSAIACSRRSNCSRCPICMRRFLPPARSATGSTRVSAGRAPIRPLVGQVSCFPFRCKRPLRALAKCNATAPHASRSRTRADPPPACCGKSAERREP